MSREAKMRPRDLVLVCQAVEDIYPNAIAVVQRVGWIDFIPEFGGDIPVASIEVSTGKLVTASASQTQINAHVVFTSRYPAAAQMSERGDLHLA